MPYDHKKSFIFNVAVNIICHIHCIIIAYLLMEHQLLIDRWTDCHTDTAPQLSTAW